MQHEDQCVWLPQLHFMTITCLGIQKYVEHSYCDFLCEIKYYHKKYHCHFRYADIILIDILHLSWEGIVTNIAMLQLR